MLLCDFQWGKINRKKNLITKIKKGISRPIYTLYVYVNFPISWSIGLPARKNVSRHTN